jgi:DNA excision repair protein ERCC-3
VLTYRKEKKGDFVHLPRLNGENWGLVVYDEVHLLPAPVFRFTSEIQSRRRLGLTATLVREDGRERDVFSLIGPKMYDVPWKTLEAQGWIAAVTCREIRVDLDEEQRRSYMQENRRDRFKRASLNDRKVEVLQDILDRHPDEPTLIIGQYISQIEGIARLFRFPIITGKTEHARREELYRLFRSGDIGTLVVSKVANFAVDLPDASVAIQVSGTFGSRQEEAQRLGRILRPKNGKVAHFYSIVTRETIEMEYAERRQLFLVEQGYSYQIVNS